MHDINWDKDTAVDSHLHFHQRCAVVVWYICVEDNTSIGTYPLPSVYNFLIYILRRPILVTEHKHLMFVYDPYMHCLMMKH